MATRGDDSLNYFQIVDSGDRDSVSNTPDGRGKSGRRIRGKLGENIHDVNFKSIAQAGLAVRMTRMGSEVLGAYTNNKLRQRKVEKTMNFMQYGLGIGIAGGFGVAYAMGDIFYRGLSHNIDIDKNNREAQRTRERAGGFTYSGNRFGGRRL